MVCARVSVVIVGVGVAMLRIEVNRIAVGELITGAILVFLK